MPDSYPVLYILARTDLKSMNSGKLAAQASHASNAFWKAINDSFIDSEGKPNTPTQNLANEWQLQTDQGFGTVLVLSCDETEMRLAVAEAERLGFVAGVVHDPTYPIRVDPELGAYLENHRPLGGELMVGEGQGYVMLPVDTCAYVFMDKNDYVGQLLLSGLNLHP